MSLKSTFKHWLWGWTHHDPWPYVEFRLNQGWKARRSAWSPEVQWLEAVHPGQQFGDLSDLQQWVVFPGKGGTFLPFEPNSADRNIHDWTVWE